MKMFCLKCKEEHEHDYVDSSEDKDGGDKVNDTSYLYSSRGIKSDYRTTKCTGCGFVFTYDFATD